MRFNIAPTRRTCMLANRTDSLPVPAFKNEKASGQLTREGILVS
jgi:hypothetical protein